MGVSLHRGPIGDPGGRRVTSDFEIWTKEGSGNRASLSLWDLCEGNTEEGIFYWRPWRICKGRFWKWASFSIGALLGNLEKGFIYRGLWETVKVRSVNGVSLSMAALWREPGGRVLILGTLKATQDISRKALGVEHLTLYTGSVRGTWKEGSYTDSEKLVMEGSGNRASLL
jgi:hypothetical protein